MAMVKGVDLIGSFLERGQHKGAVLFATYPIKIDTIYNNIFTETGNNHYQSRNVVFYPHLHRIA